MVLRVSVYAVGDWILTGDTQVACLHDHYARKKSTILLLNVSRRKGKGFPALDIVDPDDSIIYTAVLHSHRIDFADFPADVGILCDLDPLGLRWRTLQLNSALDDTSR